MSINERDQQVEGQLNRREFFKRAAVLGALAAGGVTMLSACDKGGEAGGGKAAAPEAKGGGGGGELSCTDTTGLEPAQISVRESLNYVDKTEKADQDCANCVLYKPAAEGECGGCATVPGPIHPKGWCSAWAAKPA